VRTSDFDYELPEAAIAQAALEPRDAARLLRLPGLTDHVFADLPRMLRPHDLLVVNRTRVRAARLRGTKPDTGGAIEVLLTRRLDGERWEALVKPARRLRAGTAVEFDGISGTVLTHPVEGVATLALRSRAGDVDDVLPSIGEVPLPPYFHGTLGDAERYQSIFAKAVGSAAASTASLHFTRRLVDHLLEAGIRITEVELDVGLDTFRPIHEDVITDHVIHTEGIRVGEDAVSAVADCRSRGGRVIAVGTTAVRTLESVADGRGGVRAFTGATDLFIMPGYVPRVVDAVITNFHAPRTTLAVLVAALVGPAWKIAYREALDRGYRFLSFGDAMFIGQLAGSR
jgi:S-adenosylmethionine:tRNA ribosyltransferase-isomerase